MVYKNRISGNGIKQQISGHKKQIFLELREIMQLDFQSEQMDILEQEVQKVDLIITTSGNGIKEQTHGRKKQILPEPQDMGQEVFLLAQKDISEQDIMVLGSKMSGSGINLQMYGRK